MNLLFWVLADSGEFVVLAVVDDYGVLVGWGRGLLGVEAVDQSISLWWNLSLVGVGWLIRWLVVGGDIEWVVSGGGHKGVGLLFLLGEEKHIEKESKIE